MLALTAACTSPSYQLDITGTWTSSISGTSIRVVIAKNVIA